MKNRADRFNRQLNRSRRNFLEMMAKAGVGPSIFKASGIAAAAMGARFAEANALSEKKFILCFHPNGAPDGAYLQGAAMKPFDKHQNDIAALEMEIKGGGHGNIFRAAGAIEWGSSKIASSSYDFQVASVLNANAPKGVLPLGIQSEDDDGIARNRGQAVSRFNNPRAAFDSFFGGVSGGGGVDNSEAIARRRSVLDLNKQGLDLINSKLGAEEKQRLELHLAAIEKLEKQLDAQESSGGSSAACEVPNVVASNSALQTYKTQGDIAVSALACGLTNVASIQFNYTQATWYANDGTPDAVDWSDDHHKANHANGADKLPELVGYMNKGIAHIVDQLKAKGIFDKTVLICVTEMGDGQGHSTGNAPIVVASGINGFDAKRKNFGSTDHNAIFSDATQLLGLEAAVGSTVHDYVKGGYVI